jgi:uracil-DNA glycosylase
MDMDTSSSTWYTRNIILLMLMTFVVDQISTVVAFSMNQHSRTYASTVIGDSNTNNNSMFTGTRIRISNAIKTTNHCGTRKNSISSSTRIVMMPEGPEVRTIVDQLQQGVGKRLVDIQFLSGRYVNHGRPDGFASFAETMTPINQYQHHHQQQPVAQSSTVVDTIVEWNAKGKFIYLILDDGSIKDTDDKDDDPDSDFQRSIWITLGMTGQFLSEKVHLEDPKYARWYLELFDVESNTSTIDSQTNAFKIYYHDQRNFGTLKFSLSAKELQTKLASLGPDVLDRDGTTVDTFLELMDSSKQDVNICKLLMNQQKISGVGNYILSEALYRAKIDPFATIGELDEELHRRPLFREIQAVATESYASKGLTRPYVGTYRSMDGNTGEFAFQLQCYGRETCVQGNPVIRETNGPHGRSIWYTVDQLFMPRHVRENNLVLNGDEQPSRGLPDDDNPQPKSKKIREKDPFDVLDGLTDPGWKHVLEEATSSESFHDLQYFLQQERTDGATIFPASRDIFQAFNLCPINQTKVVIIGQDPYHGVGQAHGLAFSVQRGVPPPPSLKNIVKEAMNDVGIDVPPHGCLESWAKQGVLLLNTVLTVRAGEANSHKNRGWEKFTDAVVAAINEDENPRVFLLWGRPAAQKAKAVDTSKHVVISTSHPSPLGASKTSSPFLGSKCFSRTNEALIELGQDPIDWQIQ